MDKPGETGSIGIGQALVAITPIIPYLPYADVFGFVPLPMLVLFSLGAVVVS